MADARCRPPDTLYEGGFFRATMSFPQDFPLNPPKMKFLTEMWHPNSQSLHIVLSYLPPRNQLVSSKSHHGIVLHFFVEAIEAIGISWRYRDRTRQYHGVE